MPPSSDRYTDYDAFADVYNRLWGAFSVAVVEVLDRLVLDHLPAGSHIVDLACGTGQLAAALTERGFKVTGIDGSSEMLRHAEVNAPEASFVLNDARMFTVESPVAAVVSTFDSLNHLMTRSDLELTFTRVQAALAPGGWFVFDLNMETGYQARWRGSSGIATDDEVVVARSSYDPEHRLGRMEFTVMSPKDGSWQRADFALEQRCYDTAEVVEALENTRFEAVQALDANDELDFDDVGRTFFVARKRT